MLINIHKQRFSNLMVFWRFSSLITKNNCPLSVLKSCPFYKSFNTVNPGKNSWNVCKMSFYKSVLLTDVSI